MGDHYTGSAVCNHCSYPLHGLDIGGACPECGRAVLASLRGDSLEHASPDYLQTLRQGITIAIAFGVAGMVTGFVTEIAPGIVGRLGPGSRQAGLWIGWLMSTFAAAGFIRFTTVDPGMGESEQPRSARRLARFGVALMVCGDLSYAIAGMVPGAPVRLSIPATPAGFSLTLPWLAMAVSGLILWAGFLFYFFQGLRYTEWLFSRARDPDGVRASRRYMILLPMIAVFGTCLCGLGPFVAKILHWNLLWTLRTRITHAIDVQRFERIVVENVARGGQFPPPPQDSGQGRRP
ncbi:MAG: hypothetical protein WCK33_03460 [Phycisphaerae bacterium]